MREQIQNHLKNEQEVKNDDIFVENTVKMAKQTNWWI